MDGKRRFQVFHDGDCPLCRREIAWLQKRDRRQQIEFIDIADPDFDERQFGKSYDELMAEIHGRTIEGQWVTGVEVFRHLYQAVGFGPLVRVTRLPIVRHGLDLGYRVFARYRTRLTGRCQDGKCQIDAGTSESTGTSRPADQLAKESV